MSFFRFLYVNGPHAHPSEATGAADLVVTMDLKGRLSKLVSGYVFYPAPLPKGHNVVGFTVGSESIQTPLQFLLCYIIC